MEYEYDVDYYEWNGKDRTQTFLNGLNPQCRAKAYLMLQLLEEYGPDIEIPKYAAPLKGVQNGLWELKGHCHKRAIRLYYWRSGPKSFFVACGELKEGKEPRQSVLNHAVRCFERWQSGTAAN